MKMQKRLIALILSLFLIIGVIAIDTPATKAAAPSTDALVADLIAYYRDYQEDATTDILRTLDEIKKIDPAQYEAWGKIMRYWSYVNTDMNVNVGVTEDGLPQDDSLCIVILGFALNPNGTMKKELVDRLEAGLASAEKYPNAYVVVTGGGTAAGNPNVTEGGLMGDWLLEHGLAKGRLIVENRAPDTVGNATNTFQILTDKYPQVNSIVMVTSDYHVPRGCILFYSKFVLSALENDKKPLTIVSNAGCYTGSKGYESISLQASGVASMAGVKLPGKRTLSQLNGMTITQDPIYTSGDTLDLRVTAHYNTGFSRDVSDLVTVSGFDPTLGADQTVTVSYTENKITISTPFNLKSSRKDVCDNTYLKNLVDEVSRMSTTMYTDASVANLTEALNHAKAIVKKGTDATYEEITNAYQSLNQAVKQLVKMPNIAYKMDVTANCNQGNAYKINDGVKNTSNYWASENNGNVASKDAELVIDLDGLYHVEYVNVFPYWNGKRVYKYEILGSTDGNTWFKLGENTSDNYITDQGVGHEVNADVAYLKLHGLETKVEGRPDINNIHIIELEVYGYEANNLAYGKPVTSSGTDTSAGSSSGSSDAQINDGDRTTYWDGGVYADRPWVCVDLGDVYQLDSLNVITYWARTDNRYYYYDIYTSVDGKDFQLLHSKTEGTDKSTIKGEDIDVSDHTVYARYVKLVGTYDSVNASFHLNELRVYGHEVNYELIVAKNNLSALVEEALKADLTNRTEESIQALHNAIANAQSLLTDDAATLEAVQTAHQSLEAALSGLTYLPADYTKLDQAIKKAQSLKKDDYVDFSGVEAAMNAVDHTLNITQQAQVDAMEQAITDAIAALELKPADKSLLEQLIAKSVAMDLKGYTAESVDAFQTALKAAQAVMADDSLKVDKQEVVDAAAAQLNAAIEGLTAEAAPETKPDTNPDTTPDTAPDAKPDTAPQTGDRTNPMLWMIVTLVSLSCVLFLSYKRKAMQAK